MSESGNTHIRALLNIRVVLAMHKLLYFIIAIINAKAFLNTLYQRKMTNFSPLN